MNVFCGIDWSDDHHDVAVVDGDGDVVTTEQIGNDLEGFARLVEILTEAGETADGPVPVAIETPEGLARRCPGRVRSAGVSDQSVVDVALSRPAPDDAERSPTRATRWCSPTSCGPTATPIARCRPTASLLRALRVLTALSKTQSETACG